MSSVFSVLAGIVLLITSVMLLDALRKEQETAFKGKYGDEIRTTNVMNYNEGLPGLAKEKSTKLIPTFR